MIVMTWQALSIIPYQLVHLLLHVAFQIVVGLLGHHVGHHALEAAIEDSWVRVCRGLSVGVSHWSPRPGGGRTWRVWCVWRVSVNASHTGHT